MNCDVARFKRILNEFSTMALSRVHTSSAKAADLAKVLRLNKRTPLSQSLTRSPHTNPRRGLPTPNCNPNPNHKITQSGLSPKSNRFFLGPCVTFPPNVVKIGWLSGFFWHNPVD